MSIETSNRQLKALMKKNLILKKRNTCTTICELFFPLILMLLLGGVKLAFPLQTLTNVMTESDFMSSNSTMILAKKGSSNTLYGLKTDRKFSACGWRNKYLAVGDPDLVDKAIFAIKLVDPAIDAITTLVKDVKTMREWVAGQDYASPGKPEVCFGFSIVKLDSKSFNFTINFFSERGRGTIPNTNYPVVDYLRTQPDTGSFRQWQSSGYLTLTKILNDIIFQNVTGSSTAKVDFGVLAQNYTTYKSDTKGGLLAGILPFFIVIAYLSPLVIMVYRMISEKESRSKEGMKMMGLSDGIYFLSWFLEFLVINVFFSIFNSLILAAIVFKSVNFIQLFLVFFLYGLTVFSLAFFFQSFMERTRIAIIFSILVYFLMYFVSFVASSEVIDGGVKMAASLLPPCGLQLGLGILTNYERNNFRFSIADTWRKFDGYAVSDMYLMFFIDTLIYLFLGFYLDNVLPKEYGTSRPFYFLFTKKYWCGSDKSESKVYPERKNTVDNELLKKETENFQEESNYEEKLKSGDCFRLKDVVKEYDDGKVAVNKLSFNLYKNEIFALLGHNGAGKSTLISMLAGLFPPTEGEALYQNENTFSNMENFRKKVGICPQHDVLFEQLTVKEHLEMFCIFKGVEGDRIESEVDKIVGQMNIADILGQEAGNLSGGQKRKLSISIALVGGSEVVFLDEPSSGMDITSRRKLWDILKKCMTNRIIILTTHYMEEAAVLGNRVGIISEGELQCIGTPLFLINRFGKYFNLNFRLKEKTNCDKIIEYIKSKFPDSNYIKYSEELSFQITKTKEMNLREFFEQLDKDLEMFDVESYSASMPSLEDVFLTVANREHNKYKERNGEDAVLLSSESQHDDIAYTYDKNLEPEIGACAKFSLDLKYSMKKRFLQIIRDTKTFLMEILCPIIIVIVGLAVSLKNWYKDSQTLRMSGLLLSNQTAQVNRNPFLSNQSNINADFLSQYNSPNLTFKIEDYPILNPNITSSSPATAANVMSYIIDTNKYLQLNNPVDQYGNYIITKLNTATHAHEFILVSNMLSRSTIPLFIQEMVTNIIRYDTGLKDLNIIHMNSPMPTTYTTRTQANQNNDSTLVFFVSLAFALIPSSFITLIIKERETNVKHLQIISGISYSAYWISNFIFELCKYYFTTGICLAIIKGFDKMPDNLYIFYLLYGVTMVAFTYSISFFFKNESAAQNITIFINFLVGALGGVVLVMLRINDDTAVAAKIIAYFLRIVPSFSFSYAYNSMLSFTLIKNYDFPDTPDKEVDQLSVDYIGTDVIYLGVFFGVFLISLLIIEFIYSIKQNETTSSIPDLANVKDEEVSKEIQKANQINVEESVSEDISIKIKNLEKTYSSPCCDANPKLAVNKLSLCLKYGECFALLGINGAGKTTTFKCLTNEEHATGGNIFINGMDLSKNFTVIRNLIGYCPQFDAIFEFLTVYENLEFYANIKGISAEKIVPIIESLMKELNLNQYRDKISGRLSGGNKRKLSVGIAMLGNPPIILLDEPSTGLDPESRKFMWNVIHKISLNRKKSSVILTTHSMEEAESLCKRIGIMTDGQFRCLGTSQSIKDRYGTGYEIPVRISNIPEAELGALLEKLGLRAEELMTEEFVIEILAKLEKKDLSLLLKEEDGLGSEIYKELTLRKETTVRKFLNWIHYTESFISFLKNFNTHFDQIRVTEYLENNYTIEINKSADYSIGKIFGILEELKDSCNVNEYSISQTSLEKIFNKFARESEMQKETREFELELKKARAELLISHEFFEKKYEM